MKKKLIVLILFCSVTFAAPYPAITYSGGLRFGDCLLCYLHAKWISYHYQMALLYKPFEYSSELMLHEKEPFVFDVYKNTYRKIVDLGSSAPLNPGRGAPILYVCGYFPEDAQERKRDRYHYQEVQWEDPEFRKIIKECITPIKPVKTLELPEGFINIAIHVRDGGGFDSQWWKDFVPNKFPPMSFYIGALLKMIDSFKDKPLYCYIFTDSMHPENIVKQFQEAIPADASVIFDYRKEGNRHDANVLEDFYSLFKFDALIRSQSNFSVVQARINDYAIVMSFPDEISINEGTYNRLMVDR